jgi:hypothetical protein
MTMAAKSNKTDAPDTGVMGAADALDTNVAGAADVSDANAVDTEHVQADLNACNKQLFKSWEDSRK